jgi:predicted nuclease of restriction endonuclease-like (RecB) superfamily
MKKITRAVLAESEQTAFNQLFLDISHIIEQAKHHAAITVNSILVLTYWRIGGHINQVLLEDNRAEYGERVVVKLSKQLTMQYGKGYSRPNLFRMVKFCKVFCDEQIVSTLSRQLSWSHFQELLSIDDELHRKFYVEMCRIEKWGVRELRAKIGSKLFERTTIAKYPENIIEKEINQLSKTNLMSAELVFKDPYILNFLQLGREYSEKDLEKAILDEIVKFIKELGSDFSFVDRQKRISVANEDYYLDLLFFHRRLRRLIAVELKLESFKPAHKGQMELYLRWLDKYEKCPGEESPLGIILCADKKQELVELLEVNHSGIHVAKYVTELKPLQQLEGKLHAVLELAQETIVKRTNSDKKK